MTLRHETWWRIGDPVSRGRRGLSVIVRWNVRWTVSMECFDETLDGMFGGMFGGMFDGMFDEMCAPLAFGSNLAAVPVVFFFC